MQSRPPLTLRKPSAASPEAIAAFVGKAEDESISATPNTSDAASNTSDATSNTSDAAIHPTPNVAVSPAAPAPAPAPALRSVPRKKLSAVSAPLPAGTATPSFRRASHAIEQRRTRPARRRTTVYLDVEIAAELAGVLAERDQELSDAVNSAVRDWLKAHR